jgi:hypothetical protein
MSEKLCRTATAFLLFALSFFPALSQQFVCKTQALRALRPIPELKYECSEDSPDWEEKILMQPNRLEAIKLYTKSLEKFNYADWWNSSVEDLNLCYFRRKAGRLSKEEKRDYEGGDYYFTLGGNNQYRIIIARDPCYQTGYGGANIFLLNRVGSRVFASEIIDGFYTRADFPLGFDYAVNGNETIIEIATTSGGLYPTETYYYFTIDKRTNRAVPKLLFKDNGKMTNQIYSEMILGEPEEYGLPPKSVALKIIKNHRLMKSFYVFEDALEILEGGNHKLVKVLFKWNGKFYE